jgi:hypothetical protein
MRFVAEAAAVSVNAARDGPEHVLARSLKAGFVVGACVGVLGGLIGLGGAEFRLPLLIGLFGFLALQAVILNKAMSLVVVATALPARLLGVPLDAGHPRPATSDPTKGGQAHRADSLKESQLAARSGPSPPRRTSPTRRIETASLEAAARRC